MPCAVSVTTKRTSTPSRFTLPGSTMPPMRMVRPAGAFFSTTSVGLKKNTRLFSNAVRTSAATMPSATRPPPIAASFLCLGFTLSLQQKEDLQKQQNERHGVGAPQVERVVFHPSLSRIMQRTRTSVTAMLYIQKASAMSSIAVSICDCMLAPLVTLTDAPWCSVFHHCTE